MKNHGTQSPIFTRTYDLLCWLLPHTRKWPRIYRFTLTQEVIRSALRFQERILEAAITKDTTRLLEQAEVELAKVRLYLRLGYDLKIMSGDQYAYVSELIGHVGRLLGAWRSKSGATPYEG